jgi:HAD superfamily phosphoserine phosphatase-like hydrolase
MTSSQTPGRIASFFDLDGTLLPSPSLERRFATALRIQRAIPFRNYFLWLAQAARLSPQGLIRMTHANKMYLHNISVSHSTLLLRGTGTLACPEERRVYPEFRRACVPVSHHLPAFFPGAIQRASWHATQGHTIILVSGTLEPLARQAALALTIYLLARGITTSIGVCATRLEETHGRWTGRVVDEAIFGEAKARAVQRIAAEGGLHLARCYAYGDTANDRWMLGAVGWPAAVNPSRELERIARLRSWPVLLWKENPSQHASAAATTEPCRGVGCESIPNVKSEILG